MKKIKVFAVITAALMLIGVYFTSVSAMGLGDGINLFGDGANALAEYFGLSGDNNNANENDPDANDDDVTKGNSQVNLDSGISSILQGVLGSAANALTNSQITDILNNFDINDLLGGDSDVINEVLELIGANQPSTSKRESGDSGNKGNSGSNNSGNSGSNNSGNSSSQSNSTPQYTNAPEATYAYSGSTASTVTTTMFGETTTGIGETTTLSYVAPSTIYAEQFTTLPFDYPVNTEQTQANDGLTLKMVLGIVILLISGVAVVGVALSLKKSKV